MSQASTESQDPLNPIYVYVGAFVDELQRACVHNVVICPGSRSTPLALAFAAQPAIRTWMHVDERSAAYFGLGMAKRLRQPVALLCTSGTAAANFLPAIVEAKLTHVPLLVLTADRPHELRDDGAPQSIDQNRLYGQYVKWFVELALPEASNAALRYIRTIADRTSALTQAIPAGPVHLNFPFREPLTPEAIPDQPLPQFAQRDLVAWYGRPDNDPYIQVRNAPISVPTDSTVTRLMELVQEKRRGLIIVGPNDDPSLGEPLVRLAQRLGYPVLADPLSQLRCGIGAMNCAATSYDAFLRIDSFVEKAQPELVLRFGAMPTSKAVLLYLKRWAEKEKLETHVHSRSTESGGLGTHPLRSPSRACPLIVIDGQEGWEEPTQLASELIHADPAALCQEMLDMLVDRDTALEPQRQDWLGMWQDADRITQQTIQAAIRGFDEFFEGRVFTELADLLPDGSTLYVGNSMPVRDLDTFFHGSTKRVRIMGNRGANGIDGVVSSALGAASVGAREDEPTILVLGDLSFFHDLNGLLAARLHGLNLTIVLINNDGGGIFSFLPQATHQEHFEQLFGTPTGLDFRLAVQMYGGQHQTIENWEQFRKLVNRGLQMGGLHVIEVPTERASNVSMHRQLWNSISATLP